MLVTQSCLTLCNPMDCSLPGSSPWNSPGKNTGVGCHSLLQGIFLAWGLNPSLLHYRQTFYCLSHQGSPLYQTIVCKFEQNRKGSNLSSFLYWITVDQFITIWLFKYGIDVIKLLEYSGGACEVFIMKGKIKTRSGFKYQNAQEESKARHLRSVSNYYQFSIWIL